MPRETMPREETILIEEQIVLQYAVPHFDQDREAGVLWWSEGAKNEPQVNWERVLRLSLFHDVFPCVYRHLEYTGWKSVPDEAVGKFRKAWHHHLARNIILHRELNRVLELLATGGIKAIPLKGVLLAGLLYPDVTLRSFNDLDIWIRPQDKEKAEKLLQQIDYKPRVTAVLDYSAENEYSFPFYRYFPHNRRVYLDLHWRLAKSRDYQALPEKQWWNRAEEVWINDQRYFSFVPDDMFIYLAMKIHASAYCYLKQFIDLYQLLNQWGNRLDWGYIHQTTKEMGMANNLSFLFLTIEQLFDGRMVVIQPMIQPPPKKDAPKTTPLAGSVQSLRFHFLRHIINKKTILSGRYGRDLRQGLCLLLNDHLINSFASTLRILFPSKKAICGRYLLSPHSKKIYFFYCLNPLLIAYWFFRGIVVKSSDEHGLGVLLRDSEKFPDLNENTIPLRF